MHHCKRHYTLTVPPHVASNMGPPSFYISASTKKQVTWPHHRRGISWLPDWWWMTGLHVCHSCSVSRAAGFPQMAQISSNLILSAQCARFWVVKKCFTNLWTMLLFICLWHVQSGRQWSKRNRNYNRHHALGLLPCWFRKHQYVLIYWWYWYELSLTQTWGSEWELA